MSAPLTTALGWTLVHALWQTALAALLYRAWTQRAAASADVRCRAAGVALLVGFAMALATLVALTGTYRPSPRPVTSASPNRATAPSVPAAVVPAAPTTIDRIVAQTKPAPAAAALLTQGLRWLSLAWAVGVVVLATRLLGGVVVARGIRRRARPVTSFEILAACARIEPRVGLRNRVELLVSVDVDAPATLGYWRPVVLLPPALAEDEALATVEPLLAHELAHVRARDYGANLVQSALDALLFFAPGARWLSTEIRRLREYRCDDTALALADSRTTYAHALAAAAVPEAHRYALLPVPGIAGPRLADRLRRLLEGDTMTTLTPYRVLTFTAATAAVLVVGAWLGTTSWAHTAETPKTEEGRLAFLASLRERLKEHDAPEVITSFGSPLTSPVHLERVHGSDAYKYATVHVRNTSARPIHSVWFLLTTEANPPDPALGATHFETTAPYVVDLPVGGDREMEVNLIPPSRAAALAKEYGGYAIADLTLVGAEYGDSDGGRWEVRPKAGARSHVEAFPHPAPRLGGDRIVKDADAPTEFKPLCLDDDGMDFSNGFPIKADDGRWAKCRNGAWVEFTPPPQFVGMSAPAR
jgi:beta-lactamase regulating signal transducer with metallopeptidase domain